MRYVAVTICTNRKRQSPSPQLQARNLPAGKLSETASTWARSVAASEETFAAEHLYCGRAFSEARAATKALDAGLWIVSAGLGLVEGVASVPAYSLTIALRSVDSVTTKVLDDEWSAPAWWSEVGKSQSRNSLSGLFSKYPNATFLVALSEPYARMVCEDLAAIEYRQLHRLRLFGLSLERALDERFQVAILPYDRRLDGPDSSISGTLSDFAPRALRHFSELVRSGLAGTNGPEGDRAAVRDALTEWRLPEIPKRTPKSDRELQHIIRKHWDVAEGRSGQMLRHLRDNLLVACEQSRFRRLFKEVAETRAGVQEKLR